MAKYTIDENPRTLKNIRTYWQDNILTWENSRYSISSYLNPFSFPIRKRLKIGSRWLIDNHNVADHWLELGCGSGRLLQSLQKSIKINYLGIDFADSALQIARKKYPATEIQFINTDILEFRTSHSYTGIIALGVADWIPLSLLMQNPTYTSVSKVIISFNQKKKVILFMIFITDILERPLDKGTIQLDIRRKNL